MSGHTPGKWTYDPRTDQVDCDGGTICHGIGWAPNGPLLAAAPALLDALRRLTALIEEPRQPNLWETDAVLMAARAALAAAVGDAGKEGS
jgi:hypothetical protein